MTEQEQMKYFSDMRKYEALVAELRAIEELFPFDASGRKLYITETNVDAENADVPHNHPEFYERCYYAACM